MKTYKEMMEKREYIETVTCDVCNKTFKYEDNKDIVDLQEMHSIDFVGGFGSVFGDGVRVHADICQHCLKNLLGDVLKREPYEGLETF